MPSLICVDPAYVKQLWPLVSGLIKRAIDRGFSDFATVEQNVHSGQYLLWLVLNNGGIQVAIITGLAGDACEIIALAGSNIRSCIHLISGIEKYARDEGRVRMRIIGRKGWMRLLPEYKQTSVVLERRL